MATLLKLLEIWMPRSLTAPIQAAVLGGVKAWLHNEDVQELLTAAWDPALAIKREDHGLQAFPERVDDQGPFSAGRVYLVAVRVRGMEYSLRYLMRPEEQMSEQAWELAEHALRRHLVERAIFGEES